MQYTNYLSLNLTPKTIHFCIYNFNNALIELILYALNEKSGKMS